MKDIKGTTALEEWECDARDFLCQKRNLTVQQANLLIVIFTSSRHDLESLAFECQTTSSGIVRTANSLADKGLATYDRDGEFFVYPTDAARSIFDQLPSVPVA